MADISKCKDTRCPSKEFCYRFTAPDGMVQAYADFHREDDSDNCNMFIANKNNNPTTNLALEGSSC